MLIHSLRTGLLFIAVVAVAAVPTFASHTHRGPTSGHWKAPSPKKAAKAKTHGQRQIDSTRATQIQQALIKQNYLSGEPSGQWDQQTEAAMQKFQADHGWQTKLMPDSRALIKLGLGPNANAEDHGNESSLSAPLSGRSAFGNSFAGSNSISR